MNSVMNFLAEYYIWFFVAALLLSFALIGFIIDTKKKQKNEFKGESIDSSSVTEVINEPVNISSEIQENNNLQTVNQIPVSEETMEINDIPFNEPNIVENPTQNITIGTPISSDDFTDINPQIEELNINEVPETPIQSNSEIELESLSFDDNDENKNA